MTTTTDHHRDDLDDLNKNSGAANPPAERMDTGMVNRAFDTRHSPRAIRDAPADFPPSRKHPHEYAKPLDCGKPSPLSLSKWLTFRCLSKPKASRDAQGTQKPDDVPRYWEPPASLFYILRADPNAAPSCRDTQTQNAVLVK